MDTLGHVHITIILDHSCVISDTHFHQIKSGIENLQKNFTASEDFKKRIHFQVIGLNGIHPIELVAFDQTFDSINLKKQWLPLTDRVIRRGLENLISYRALYNQEELYKAFTFILSSGLTYEPFDQSIKALKELTTKDKMSFFTFTFEDYDMNSDFEAFLNLKKAMPIKKNHLEYFFDFISKITIKRIELPIDQTMRLSREMLEGWVDL
jgi:hypothetical protein